VSRERRRQNGAVHQAYEDENVTRAVCVKCGAMKFGALTTCDRCGTLPNTDVDLGYSMALTDHYFSVNDLKRFSDTIKKGQPISEYQDETLKETARMFIEDFRVAGDE